MLYAVCTGLRSKWLTPSAALPLKSGALAFTVVVALLGILMKGVSAKPWSFLPSGSLFRSETLHVSVNVRHRGGRVGPRGITLIFCANGQKETRLRCSWLDHTLMTGLWERVTPWCGFRADLYSSIYLVDNHQQREGSRSCS